MSLKGKMAEFALFNVIKWCMVIIFAGIILYLVTPKYEFLNDRECFNKITGRIHPIKKSY